MPAMPWGKLKKLCKARGIQILNRGSEAKLHRENPDGTVDMYMLQHKCCRGESSTVWACHVAAIARKFNL